jgi:5-(carboxyamino)imidazole ribonucleotide mutase
MASQDLPSRKVSKKAPAVVPPVVSVIMGSKSDWDTMKAASDVLTEFGVAHECRVISAHRTPEVLTGFATTAEQRGIEVIIAGAGGAAHLAGVTAAQTVIPVLGVPIESKALHGMDSLLSIVQMPGGIPVGTLAIGTPGAKNAALFAIAIMAAKRTRLRDKLKAYREKMKRKAAEETLP